MRVPRLHFRVPRLHFGIDSEMQVRHFCESARFAFQNGRVGCEKQIRRELYENSMKTELKLRQRLYRVCVLLKFESIVSKDCDSL